MKIDLIKFVENNKNIENLREEAKKKTELNNLISSIIRGEEYFYTDNKELLEDIEIKYTKKVNNTAVYIGYTCTYEKGEYKVKLTKENVKKVQKYIDKEN